MNDVLHVTCCRQTGRALCDRQPRDQHPDEVTCEICLRIALNANECPFGDDCDDPQESA